MKLISYDGKNWKMGKSSGISSSRQLEAGTYDIKNFDTSEVEQRIAIVSYGGKENIFYYEVMEESEGSEQPAEPVEPVNRQVQKSKKNQRNQRNR